MVFRLFHGRHRAALQLDQKSATIWHRFWGDDARHDAAVVCLVVQTLHQCTRMITAEFSRRSRIAFERFFAALIDPGRCNGAMLLLLVCCNLDALRLHCPEQPRLASRYGRADLLVAGS